MNRPLLVVAAVFFFGGAGCTREPYLVVGAGVTACTAYAAMTARHDKDRHTDWISGYLVARQFSLDRRLNEKALGGSEWRKTIENWTDRWCAAQPSRPVSEAAAALSDELLGR